MPITKIRLMSAVVTALGFGIILYLASANFNPFTFAVYLALGISVGFAVGYFEAKQVLTQISSKTEASLWKIPLVSAVLILLPLFLVGALYGFTEIRFFLAYVVLPAIPAYLGVSGWQYQKFETENSVQIYSTPYGFKFWTQPTIGYSEQFHYFLKDIQTKDNSSMWQHIGYGKIYLRELEKRTDLTPEAIESTRRILKTFSPYRMGGLTILALIAIGGPLILLFSFTSGFGMLKMPSNAILNITMPIVCVLFVGIFASTFLLMHLFKKKMGKLLSQVDSDKFYAEKAAAPTNSNA